MKVLKLLSTGAVVVLTAAFFSAPVAAQTTWNFGDSGNCDITGNTATLNCTVGNANNTLRAEGFAASTTAGARYVRGTLSNQGGSGMGFTAPGESTGAPQHAFDNNGSHELLLLNFGFNRVVVTGVTTGWSQQDTDVSLLRWNGAASGPTMTNTANFATSSLLAAGWVLVGSADLDGQVNGHNTFNNRTYNTGIAATTVNSSSWWIISSYFGANSGHLDHGNDYFKLLSVSTACVGNTGGGACNTDPNRNSQVPEPGSLALVALALVGIAATRRRRTVA